MRKLVSYLILIASILWIFSLDFSRGEKKFQYGVSFSKFHSEELNLNWKEVFLALLDLGVRNFRFSAHWPLTEPAEGQFNFEELDFQMNEARRRGASVILAVGRRLPGWPECHEPEWIKNQTSKFKNERILKYAEAVVNRYKNYDNLKYWQIENEPFLGFFGRAACGKLDSSFLKEEIKLVREISPLKPIIITDSGEFGSWFRAYNLSDAFGTSMYLYVWNRYVGPLRYPITPAFFRIKKNIIGLIYGKKPSFVAELSAEPWLLQPIVDTPVEIQLERMGIDKFNKILSFSDKTGFDTFYLWGAEWWYWMKQNGYPEFWDRARELFKNS